MCNLLKNVLPDFCPMSIVDEVDELTRRIIETESTTSYGIHGIDVGWVETK